MRQKNKIFSNAFMHCICALAVVAIAVGAGYSFAILSHSASTDPQTLSFGMIEIVEGSNAVNIDLGAIIPGETKKSTDPLTGKNHSNSLVSFKPTNESLPCYLRVSIKVELKNKGSSTLADDVINQFVNSLNVGTGDSDKVKLTLGTNVGTWVYNSDGYFYLMKTSRQTELQSVNPNQEAYFITEIKFSSDIKNEIAVGGSTYKDVQSGLSFRFKIVCQAIQTANVNPTLNDSVKGLFK